MRRKFKSKTVNTMLNLAAISIVVCTLQQLYSSSNNSNTGGGNNLATATSSSSEDMLSIMAVGDSIGYNIDGKKLSNLSQIIKAPDIFIFNLEGVLIDSMDKEPECKGFPAYQSVFVNNSSFVRHLKLAPITIANLANNHTYDCGSEGIKETKKNTA